MSHEHAWMAQQGALLRRVRMGEEPAGAEKTVWHSSGGGVDLTTNVDAAGRAVTQELVMRDRMLRWRNGEVQTGLERTRPSKAGREVSSEIAFDKSPDPETLELVLTLCSAAPGDRYVHHLESVVRSAQANLPQEITDTVTVFAVQAPKIPEPPVKPETLVDRLRKLFK